MFIKKLFRVRSGNLQFFKVFEGFKFRFEVLKFLIIKVNAAIDLKLFQDTLKPLLACRIKKNLRGGLPAHEKCRPL